MQKTFLKQRTKKDKKNKGRALKYYQEKSLRGGKDVSKCTMRKYRIRAE